jgi:hypothetical protein
MKEHCPNVFEVYGESDLGVTADQKGRDTKGI